MKKEENLIGKRFGRWLVLSEDKTSDPRYPKFWCLCECGQVSSVGMYALLSKKSESCGCLHKEKVAKVNYKHGFYQERLYHVWVGMKQRCTNPNHIAYNNYGGRGIKVCKEWLNDYTKFRDFMLTHGYNESAPFGECTIDRIDNDGDYCPGNCRIVSISEQNVNKHDVFSFILDGKRTTISGAARSKNKTRSCIQYRLKNGWSLEDAVEEPLREIQKYEANGESHTVKEWADILKVTVNVIRGRLQTHTMQEIVNEWNSKGYLDVKDTSQKFYTVDGIVHGQKEWSELLGIPNSTLRYKLKKKSMQEIVDDLRKSGKEIKF